MTVDSTLLGNILVGASLTSTAGNPEHTEPNPDAPALTVTLDKVYTITKSKGQTAGAAKGLVATVNSQTVVFSGTGTTTSPSLTFTAQKTNSTTTVNWTVASLASSTALTPVTTYLSASSGDSVTMTSAQFNAARGSGDGVVVTATLIDGSTLVEKISVIGLRSAAVTNPAAPAEAPVAGAPAGAGAPVGDAINYTTSTNFGVIGDSIAKGVGDISPAPHDQSAVVGISPAAVAALRLSRSNYDYVIISSGSNNPNMTQLAQQLRETRANVSARRYVWILPVGQPQAAQIVQAVAAEHNDITVGFTLSNDRIHPASYQRLRNDIVAKLGQSTSPSATSTTAPAATPPTTPAPATPTAVGTPPAGTASGRYIGFLTNETHILATDNAGSGGNFASAGGTMRVFDGDAEVTTGHDIAYSVVNVSTGLQIAVDASTGVYTVSGLTADTGTATIRATYQQSQSPAAPAAGAGAGGGGIGGAAGPVEQFLSCKDKYGVTDDEAQGTENEGSAHPYGTTPEGLARQRAVELARNPESDPTGATATNGAAATPVGCEGCDQADDNFQLSPRFTVGSFSSHAILPHSIGTGSSSIDPTTGHARLYGRAEIICNLRHLAVNALEPLFTHFTRLGYSIQISSAYRPGNDSGQSDHYKGSAADLIFNYNGQRIGGRHLTRVQMCIDQVLHIPYTQMIFETPGSNGDILHVACRRVGGNSGTRNAYSMGNGHGDFHSGYKFTVSLDDGPPVR